MVFSPSCFPARARRVASASAPPALGRRRVSDTATLEAARSLFNEGDYLAAHELFEELWEATSGPDADCYKGLLQAAVALHHLSEGNGEGALRLYRGHRRYLAPYPPGHLGLDLGGFLEAMQRAFRPLLEGDPARPGVRQPRPRLEHAG